MVKALVQGLEDDGDNDGYVPKMCIDHSLVASHSSQKKISSHFGCLESGTFFPL